MAWQFYAQKLNSSHAKRVNYIHMNAHTHTVHPHRRNAYQGAGETAKGKRVSIALERTTVLFSASKSGGGF